MRGWRPPRPRWSWVVAGIVTTLLGLMLVVAGLAGSEVANDALARDPVGDGTVPVSVHEGGPIVDATSGVPESRTVPDRTLVLTFDDGPDPRWTPEVLAVLRKHQVPGTFFVVGSMAARHPDLVQAIHASGSELGTHTFTHPDLVAVSGWRMDQEMDQTQLTLTGGAGVRSRLFRPPFSSTAAALDDLGYQTVPAAGRLGYVSVFTDFDSEDWARPGVDAIVRNATPPDDRGGIVLRHDAGGDRSQTVAALDRLIPDLKAREYRFATVSAAADLPGGNQPASADDRFPGQVLIGAILVPLMLVHGWSTVITSDDENPLRWTQLVFWVAPVLDPPGSSWPLTEDGTSVLWYLRAYLWFVLLTPLLLRAFRRRPLLALAAPPALVAADSALGSPLSSSAGVSAGVLDFAIFGTCWMLGFAHRDGLLRRLSAPATLGLAVVLAGLGGLWTWRHPAPGVGFDLNEIPLGQALVGAGAVLVLLRWSPSMGWLSRMPVLGALVSAISARAITIYLWHNIAIDLAFAVMDGFGWTGGAARFATTTVLVAAAVLAFGWVEDLAAGRRPRLLPALVRPGNPAPPDRVGEEVAVVRNRDW